jgi:hypothetical protein
MQVILELKKILMLLMIKVHYNKYQLFNQKHVNILMK